MLHNEVKLAVQVVGEHFTGKDLLKAQPALEFEQVVDCFAEYFDRAYPEKFDKRIFQALCLSSLIMY